VPEAAVERAFADLGGLHILVNNVGITRDNLLFRMSDEVWDAVIAVHLRGAFPVQPGDAGVIAFLVGPDACYVTGRRSTSTAAVRTDWVTWVAPACHPRDLWREGHVSPGGRRCGAAT
jgi:hypothetical protein